MVIKIIEVMSLIRVGLFSGGGKEFLLCYWAGGRD